MTTNKQNNAFTLPELMIIVAIIGVLAAIAIPNYQNYKRQARRVQAQTALADLYTAEQAFYSEYLVYAGSFLGIGYKPTGDYYYTLGFNGQEAGPCGRSTWGGGDDADMFSVGCGPRPKKEIRAITGRVMFYIMGNSIPLEAAVSFPQISSTNRYSYCKVGGNELTVMGGNAMQGGCSYVGPSYLMIGRNGNCGANTGTYELTAGGKGVKTCVRETAFSAGAIADLYGTMDMYDAWGINHNKELKNIPVP